MVWNLTQIVDNADNKVFCTLRTTVVVEWMLIEKCKTYLKKIQYNFKNWVF